MNRQEKQEQDERLMAYLEGEMTPDEAAAFDAFMEKDETLRVQCAQWRKALDAAREWTCADAPGVERVENLQMPVVPQRAKPVSAAARRHVSQRDFTHFFSLRWLVWAGAAAAIFIAGFGVGQMAGPGALPLPRGGGKQVVVDKADYPTPTPEMPTPSPVPKEQTAATSPTREQPSERGRVEVADIPTQRYTDEHGRLVVETTLKGSGARAFWVVDGTFQLAQSVENR